MKEQQPEEQVAKVMRLVDEIASAKWNEGSAAASFMDKMGERRYQEEAAEARSEIEAEVRASLLPPTGWQPIDGPHPREGQEVLLWVNAVRYGEDDHGNRFEQDQSQVCMGMYRNAGAGQYYDCYASPFADAEWITHWMPLPASPAVGEGAQQPDQVHLAVGGSDVPSAYENQTSAGGEQ